MVRQGYTSRNIPDDKLFEQIYWDRLKAKKEGDKVISDTYKLILNTTYGCWTTVDGRKLCSLCAYYVYGEGKIKEEKR